jgi:hypothetical protein
MRIAIIIIIKNFLAIEKLVDFSPKWTKLGSKLQH